MCMSHLPSPLLTVYNLQTVLLMVSNFASIEVIIAYTDAAKKLNLDYSYDCPLLLHQTLLLL